MSQCRDNATLRRAAATLSTILLIVAFSATISLAYGIRERTLILDDFETAKSMIETPTWVWSRRDGVEILRRKVFEALLTLERLANSDRVEETERAYAAEALEAIAEHVRAKGR